MKNIVLIMTLIVSCLFAGCDSLANKSEDKLSGDDFWAQGNETNAEAFLLSIYNSFRKQQCHNVLSLRIAEICGALQ